MYNIFITYIYLFAPYFIQINNTRSNKKSDECIGAFMAIGPRSQIIVISGISKTGCRCLDIYSCKGTYERSITVVTAPEKCKFIFYLL